MDHPQTDRGRIRLVVIVSACRFAEAMSVGMLIPILPVFLKSLETPVFRGLGAEALTAILYSGTGFVMAGAQLIAMFASDLLDRRKPLIVGGMAGACVCGLALLAVEEYWQLLVIRLLQGVFLGFTFPPLMAILTFLAPAGRGGRTIATYSSIRLFGVATGPLIGGVLTDELGFSATFITSTVLLAVSVAMVSIWVPELKDEHRQEHHLRLPRVHSSFFLLGACIFTMMLGISAIISLFPYYQDAFGASARDLGFVFAAFIGTRCLLQFPLGWLGDKVDKKRLLVVALALLAPLIALQGYAGSLSELLLLRVALGAVSAAVSTCISGMSAERSEPGNRATVMGINTFSFSLGVAFGPLSGGFLAQPPDVSPAFLLPAAITVAVAVGVLGFVPSDRRWGAIQGP